MLKLRDDNTGIDIHIDRMQRKLHEGIQEEYSSASINVFPRIYVNDQKAEHSKDYKDYERLLYDDRVWFQSFFITGSDSDIDGTLITDNLSLIVSADLRKFFGDKQRPDEYLKELVFSNLQYYPNLELQSIQRNLRDVYAEFDLTNLEKSNIQPRCVMRFNFSFTYHIKRC